MTKENFIALARSRERQAFSKILACGLGGSLLLHGIAAVVFNYLPRQILDNSVEVTLIDNSDLPPEFQSSPTPTPSIKITPTPTPTPSVKITPTPIPTPSIKIKPTPTPIPSVKITPTSTPTPSVKITPTPTPTPSIKITPTPTPTPSIKITPTPTPTPSVKITPTPTPTPSVKITPTPTPLPIKIVTQPSSFPQKPAKTQIHGDPESTANSPIPVAPNASDIALHNSPNPATSGNINPNGENAGKNSHTINNQLNFPGENQESPLIPGDNRNLGNSSSPNIGLGNNNGIGQNGSSSASSSSEASPDLGGNSGITGTGNDEFSIIIPNKGSDSLFNNPSDQTSINSNTNQNNQAHPNGGINLAPGNPNSKPNNVIKTQPSVQPGITIGNNKKDGTGSNQNIPGSTINNSGKDTSRISNNNVDTGNSPGKNLGSPQNSQPNKLPGTGSIDPLAPKATASNSNSQEKKGDFGIELACLKNCNPKYRKEIKEAAQVMVQIELNDHGQVISTKLTQSCNVPSLDNFAEVKFREMWFQLSPGLNKKIFIVTMDFKVNKQ